MTTYHLPVSKLASMTSDDHLLFVLSPYSGDADLFIATDRDPQLDANHKCTNCILGGSTPHGEIKSIKRSDNLWPTKADSVFYIGVYGYTPADYLLNVYPTNSMSLHNFFLIILFFVTLCRSFTQFHFCFFLLLLLMFWCCCCWMMMMIQNSACWVGFGCNSSVLLCPKKFHLLQVPIGRCL